MSAWLDQKNRMGFYYGNAMVDLADKLPTDEFCPVKMQTMAEVNHLMDDASKSIKQIQELRFEMAFYIKDIKRHI